jgi:hypothetical protein
MCVRVRAGVCVCAYVYVYVCRLYHILFIAFTKNNYTNSLICINKVYSSIILENKEKSSFYPFIHINCKALLQVCHECCRLNAVSVICLFFFTLTIFCFDYKKLINIDLPSYKLRTFT